jgi:hypothetical protein
LEVARVADIELNAAFQIFGKAVGIWDPAPLLQICKSKTYLKVKKTTRYAENDFCKFLVIGAFILGCTRENDTMLETPVIFPKCLVGFQFHVYFFHVFRPEEYNKNFIVR